MKKRTKQYLAWLGILIALVLIVYGLDRYSNRPGPLDSFAACLGQKNAKFYGAFWCPHCQSQKTLFGNSARLLPYVECSAPDGQSELRVCIDQKIEGYPTWIFADGSRESGELSLQTLADKTGCQLLKQ